MEKIKELISRIKVPVTDDAFYPRLFSLIIKERQKPKNAFTSICEEEYGDLSRRADISHLQEGVAIRNVLRTRALANFLISETGDFLIDAEKIEQFKQSLYSIGPQREDDASRQELILKVLLEVMEDKELLSLLKSVAKPYQNPGAEELVRETLALDKNTIVTDVHAKRAVFSSLLCYLRQSVGSCFGTAPAIMIHEEQPRQFVKDIIELLNTGRLKRTFGGFEYSVPLSYNWGVGDLKKRLLFSDQIEIEKTAIWFSPGLINALEQTSLFTKEMKLKEKIEKTKELVLDAVKAIKDTKSHAWINAEDILHTILLKEYELTKEDVKNYELSQKSLGASPFYVSSSQPNSKKNSENFLIHYEAAKTAFKILADNALLKSWEFTLASFAENKSGFTTWNLYSSLGFRSDEKGGIGEALFLALQQKLDEANRKVHDFQEEYDAAYAHVKYLETRIRTASDTEKTWLKAEYQAKVHEFRFLEEMRDTLHTKAKRLANLFNLLTDLYLQFFPQYFQEVYDAGMQDITASRYDDSPAGFRLLFKHGRRNSAQWTRIETAEEFIEALAGFFTMTEPEIRNSYEMEGLEQEFSEIVTAIVMKIRTEEFLESSFHRMAIAHKTAPIKNPLQNLDKIEAKPWAYVSGGTMSTLTATYYKREQKPAEVSRWVESPVELLTFLVDSIKALPQKLKEEYIKNPNKSMLMTSPTHAFLLKPGFKEFRQAWQSDSFTYTYIRDTFVAPRERLIQQIVLDEEMMTLFIEELVEKIPVTYKSYLRNSLKPMYQTLSPLLFRDYLVSQVSLENSSGQTGRGFLTEEEIDSKLYEELPYFSKHQLKDLVRAIFEKLPKSKKFDRLKFEEILTLFEEASFSQTKIFSSKRLQDICKAILCLMEEQTCFSINYPFLILKACQELGFSLKSPLIFADSNWVKDYFAFVVNPGTSRLELWRVGIDSMRGTPMRSWDQWVDGSRKDLMWGVYHRPYEYS
ncbi:MAG TPA: hypothetical protein PLC42_04830 [Parachlamydiaceae bacterium]|nr:hypothetical protein [Parachlamydiaceae bacterium]